MPPEYVLRALRMSLGVFLSLAIGYSVINPQLVGKGPKEEYIASLVGKGAVAAAITCVVVASPVIGKVLVVGLDRSIGTISGGFIGWACFEAAHVTWHDDYEKKWGMLSSASFFAAFLSMIIAWKVARLETTPKLFTLTFILVAFGADDPQESLGVMTARILGILAGTFISLLVAVLVYPISATEECMIGIKRAFRGLSHLNKAAIQEGRHALGKARDDMDEPQDDVADSAADEERGIEKPLLSYEEAAGHNKECEQALLAIITAIGHVTEMLELSKKEAYVGTFLGRMWFLPGLGWLGFKRLPYDATKDIVLEIRCAAWLLWRIHLAFRQMAFREGMGAHFALVLTKVLPLDMVYRLARYSQGAIDCMADSLPNVPAVNCGLEKFRETVFELMELTERQHRDILEHMRRERNWSRRQSQDAVSPNQARRNREIFEEFTNAAQAVNGKLNIGEQDQSHPQKGKQRKISSGEMEEDLWGAAKAEISIPMPEQHDHERGMSQQRLSDMAPGNDRAIFPGCVEEQVAEVRWYTFQFLMEELSEGLQRLHTKLYEYGELLPDETVELSVCLRTQEEDLL